MADVGLPVTHVAIIGGGWSGLAAGVALADAGIRVTLFEGARTLGGRARRVEVDGRSLDNGLHILIGAYRETLALMQRVAPGTAAFRRFPLTLEIAGRFRLACPRLPAPLHLLVGLAAARGLGLGDRLAAGRFMIGRRLEGFRALAGETVSALLQRLRQPRRTCELLWHPLCVAALNTPADSADAQVFLNVVRDGLDGPTGASDLVLPAADLGAMFPEPAAAFIAARGGDVRTACPVKGLHREADAFLVRSAIGTESFTHVICATDPARGASLLGNLPGLSALAETLESLHYLPIVSIYLQYPETFRLPTPMLGFANGPAQWVFDRGILCGQAGLVGAVASAATDIDRTPGDELAAAVHRQLRGHFQDLPEPLWHQVITERRATFACVPGMTRPPQRTGIPRFYLAGDYTASEYPATLEAAVRSGITCARAVLEDR